MVAYLYVVRRFVKQNVIINTTYEVIYELNLSYNLRLIASRNLGSDVCTKLNRALWELALPAIGVRFVTRLVERVCLFLFSFQVSCVRLPHGSGGEANRWQGQCLQVSNRCIATTKPDSAS